MRPTILIVVLVSTTVAAEEAPTTGTRPLQEWTLGTAGVRAVRYAADEKSIAIDLAGAAARLGEGVQAFPKATWPGFTGATILQEGAVAFVGLASGEVWRWDLAAGTRERASSRHGSTVACAGVSPDGRLVATGS